MGNFRFLRAVNGTVSRYTYIFSIANIYPYNNIYVSNINIYNIIYYFNIYYHSFNAFTIWIYINSIPWNLFVLRLILFFEIMKTLKCTTVWVQRQSLGLYFKSYAMIVMNFEQKSKCSLISRRVYIISL